jgi:hypothetical protein
MAEVCFGKKFFCKRTLSLREISNSTKQLDKKENYKKLWDSCSSSTSRPSRWRTAAPAPPWVGLMLLFADEKSPNVSKRPHPFQRRRSRINCRWISLTIQRSHSQTKSLKTTLHTQAPRRSLSSLNVHLCSLVGDFLAKTQKSFAFWCIDRKKLYIQVQRVDRHPRHTTQPKKTKLRGEVDVALVLLHPPMISAQFWSCRLERPPKVAHCWR